jgi:predicted MFS family arabinose efflux permease
MHRRNRVDAMDSRKRNGLLPTLGGFCGLAVAMGIGRFAYTALLPGMASAHGLDPATAGTIAAWNLAGYLLGVLAMRNERPGPRRHVLFVAFLLVSLATTGAMGLMHGSLAWHAIRFLAGVASGACFVLCSSIVLDTLMALNKPALAGLVYSGVGAGIALGGLAAQPLEALAGPDGAWSGLALLGVLPGAAAAYFLRPGANRAPSPPVAGQAGEGGPPPGQRRAYRVLLAAYFLEGFGYIIGATFLVALVREGTGSQSLASASWILTGCAAAVSAPLWRLAARRGYRGMLATAFFLQGVGVLLPVLSSNQLAILASGLLLGGTFMGIVALALQYAVSLSGKGSAHCVAVMTGFYGVGQIIGPVVAGVSAQGRGFGAAFALSSASLLLGAALLLIGIPRHKT